MRRRLLEVWTVLMLSATWVCGQSLNDLPQYKPEQKVSGTIRSWGSDEMAGLMKAWEQGFSKHQPVIQFSDTLKGSDTAQAGLYTDVADLALTDREILPHETYGLYRRHHYYALPITVATGSYDEPNKAFALAVFVNKDNPLSKLTLKQLDGIFGEQHNGAWDDEFTWYPERARSAKENIRTWGQLGLTGEWADKAINVYSYPSTVWNINPFDRGAAYFFRLTALGNADKWNADLLEFEKGQQITEALSKDRYGIGYTCLCYKTSLTKPIALATENAGPYLEPTKDSVASRKYPLTRSIYIYINRNPVQPLDPKVKEFLRYILSRDGQQAVAHDSGYLPLTADEVRTQLKKLE